MKRLILTLILCALFAGSTALADLDPIDSAKWAQLPDTSPTGLDIYAWNSRVMMDDFLCTQGGLITDIHIWGSWFNGYLPKEATGANPSASNITFTLSLHADIPANPTGGLGYSTPGELLWEQIFNPGQFTADLYHNGPEGWYNPSTGKYVRTNQVWQYNFDIDEQDAFMQQGTVGNPVIYWLDISATTLDHEALFGLRTAAEHFNDNAVWANSHQGPWNELIYPQGHPSAGESIDLAFAITPEPTTLLMLSLGTLALRRRKA